MARKKSPPKQHVIDGCHYKTASDVRRHEMLKENKSVTSFHLPDIKEKSSYSRYGAHKCEINGIHFDSVMEGMYYAHLLEEKRSKKIKSIECQVSFVLQEGFTHNETGKKIRPITYIADFVFTDKKNKKHIIDVKGKKTPDFKLKEKMLLHCYPDINFYCVQYDAKKKEWRNLDDIEKDKRLRKKAIANKTEKGN